MITSIGLNPCIDTVIKVKSIKPGHYDVQPKYFPGGTAINVVLVSKKLKESGKIDKLTKVFYSGFIDNGKIYKLLRKRKISTKYCVFIKGETRINYTILPIKGEEIHLKSEGPIITKSEYEKFENVYNEIIKDSNVVIISGKLPKNTSEYYYNKLIEKAQTSNIHTAIDIRGETLKQAIKSNPFFIKCNLTELSVLLNNKNKLQSFDDILDAESILKHYDIPLAVISAGKNGMFVFYKGKFLAQYKISCELLTKSTIGAGDIILFYFSYLFDSVKRDIKKLNKETINECSIISSAYASASTLTPYPSVFNLTVAEKLIKKIEVIKKVGKISFN